MANKWQRELKNALIIHIVPNFNVYGTINFDTRKMNIYIKVTSNTDTEYSHGVWYDYNMFILWTKNDYAWHGMSPSAKEELLHIMPAGYMGGEEISVSGDGFTSGSGYNLQHTWPSSFGSYSASDKYYLCMLCQVHPDAYARGDTTDKYCDITTSENIKVGSYTYINNTGYLTGSKNPGGSAVTKNGKWDADRMWVKPGSFSWINSGNDDEYYSTAKFTAVSFPIAPDTDTRNGGRLLLEAHERNAAYTKLTATATYIPAATKPAITFFGVDDPNDAGVNTRCIKIVLFKYTNDAHTTWEVIETRYPMATKDGDNFVAAYNFTVEDTSDYFVEAFIIEDLGSELNDLDATDFSDGKEEIQYVAGKITVSATRTATTVTARGKYTVGTATGKQGATRYWGTKTTGGTTTSNRSKVLLALLRGTTELETAVVANNTDFTFNTAVVSDVEYTVKAYAVELLDVKKTVGPASKTVAALGSIGSVTATIVNRTDTTITLKATYSGSTPYYATLNMTDKGKLYYFLRLYNESTTADSDINEHDRQYVDKYGTYVQRKKITMGEEWVVTGIDKYTAYAFTAYAFYFPDGQLSSMQRAHDTVADMGSESSVDPTDMNAKITGTTITLTPVFTSAGDRTVDSIEWTAKLGRVTQSGTSTKNASGEWESDPAKFALLANATTYTIVFHGLFSGAASPTPDAGDGESDGTLDTSAGYIDLLNSDVYYDAMTYGVTVLEASKTRTTFTGIAYQTIGAHGETNHAMTECGKKKYAGFCRRRDGSSVASTNVGYVSFNNGTTTVSTDVIGQSAGSANFTGSEVTITGLLPSTGYRLYVYLKGCKDFEGQYDAVGYIDFTTEAVAIPGLFQARVTGTSISVTPNIIRWNNSSDLSCMMYFNTVAGVDENGKAIPGSMVEMGYVTISPTNLMRGICYGLDTGTKYLVTFYCTDDEDNEIEIEPIEVVTYGLTIETGVPHTRYCSDCKITYVEGERMSNTPQDTTRGAAVRWFILDFDENMLISPTYANCRRSNPYYFETTPHVLTPGETYVLWAYIEGVLYEGEPDTLVSVIFTCTEPAYWLSGTTSATGTTISFTPTWIDSTSQDNIVTVIAGIYQYGVFLEQKQTTYKDVPIKFTGLNRGQEYTIVYTAIDNEGNSTNDYIAYQPGINGTIDELTYKLLFNDFTTTTRSIFFVVSSNRPDLPEGTQVQYYISQGNEERINFGGGLAVDPGSPIQYYHLRHNSAVTVGARFSTLFDENNDYDTTEFTQTYTTELTLEFDGYDSSPHAIASRWRAYSDNSFIIVDKICGQPLYFVYNKISIVPVVRGEVGDSYGNYTMQHNFIWVACLTRWFDKLSPGRAYRISMTISDGVNEATATGIASTLVPTLRIYSERDHKWHKALPYIVHNSYWYAAPAYIYFNKEKRNALPSSQIIGSNDEYDKGKFYETNPTNSPTPDDDILKYNHDGVDARTVPDLIVDDITDPS